MTPVLELQNVKRSFGSKAVLKGINLSVDVGELVALYGPSGSGKSTLLNLVGAIDRPSEGVIRLAGSDVARMWEMRRTRLRRTQIGFIFQNYPLIASYSAAENIDMSLRLKGVGLWERRRRIKAALEAVGLSDHARRLPDQLSGGQQQRVAIARVLALHPTIILADEPTSGLDTRTARRVMKIFQGLAQAEGTAFLVVSHDIDLTERFVNRAYDLRDGQLALRPPVGSLPEHQGDHRTLTAAFQDEVNDWGDDGEPEFMATIPMPGVVEPEFLSEMTFEPPLTITSPALPAVEPAPSDESAESAAPLDASQPAAANPAEAPEAVDRPESQPIHEDVPDVLTANPVEDVVEQPRPETSESSETPSA